MVSYKRNEKENNFIRYMQTVDLVNRVEESDADVKIFGGDMNALPNIRKYEPYSLLTSIMTDSLLDRYPKSSWNPIFATYNSTHNSYSSPSSLPSRIDFLMYSSAPHISMRTLKFDIPIYKIKNGNNFLSLSDHETLSADFYIK